MTSPSVSDELRPSVTAPGSSRWRLGFASAAVFFAAADMYVVVLALIAIMYDIGIGIDQLNQATPIISGFLLGYVAVLPLLGRLSDIYGRRPVFLGCLLTFAAGSLLTASAHSLPAVVLGRALQGLGGGGLVPVTLAIVADSWPAERRGAPLGVVAAVQELGSVAGPLYGAAILAFSSWRVIFWLNLPVILVLGVGFAVTSPHERRTTAAHRHRDVVGWILLGLTTLATLAAVVAPSFLTESDVFGSLYGPLFTIAGTSGQNSWWLAFSTPVALTAMGCLLIFVLWEWLAPSTVARVADVRRVGAVLQAVDWLGAALLTLALGCVVICFAAADPSAAVLASAAPILLPVAAVLLIAFVFVERRQAEPLVNFGALSDRAAIGAMLTNLAVGTALMAALVDVPIFARSTVYPDSQVQAALVLLRLLAAIPIGALVGGLICERLSYRITAAMGMALCAISFVAMTQWSATTLADPWLGIGWLHPSDPALMAAGLGFGLAIAPINASILAVVPAAYVGLASALVVVARTIGMLVGLSLLTAIGLHDFYNLASHLPSPEKLCPASPGSCPAYDLLAENAVIAELHTIFGGAAIAAAAAAVLGLLLLRRRQSDQRQPARLASVLAGG